jgi:hypothetical protein
MNYRYTNIITVVFLVMIYSSGIPILYPIAAIYLTSVYWTDKYQLFNMYKQPPMLDSYIALKTLAWFKFALFFHVLVGTLMYANSEILQSSEAGELLGPDLVEWLEGHEFFDFLQLHTLVFFLTFVGMIAVYILWKCLCKPIYKGCRK